MILPDKCVVDTNVPKTANLAIQPDSGSDVSPECVGKCIEAIEHVIRNRALVIDSGNEIFDEYRRQLNMSGAPNVGDKFMKWVHTQRWKLPDSHRVEITKNGDSYDEFPNHKDLTNFDPSDRKFVAVANAHSSRKKPSILQATDSKWWGWRDALEEEGIHVHFVCPEYAEATYKKKMGR
ncbi:MAG: hypothetical protein OXF42_02745 [Candidatus Dadabacteria bacterium]|nr:hypothetical protein [Candidatus Dadabacteria bacterium]